MNDLGNFPFNIFRLWLIVGLLNLWKAKIINKGRPLWLKDILLQTGVIHFNRPSPSTYYMLDGLPEES